ncbi:hypothetical protein MSG28_008555 [Choristoneura fumiferana]|uniref:Uncharacterized protein n=1 Tax=Choristoneura fumiferana TaxID=7141 RepID=A0ACC0J758_CHOFU|nr:hypothetical protein MSG28_008555 [Choristoneura fumiferana]
MTNNSPKRRKGRNSESLNFKRLSPRTEHERNFFREFSLRPAVVSAIRSTWWPTLRQFMVKPVLRAVDNDEPMEFLAEVRRVVIVFLNIITKSVSEELLIHIVDTAYKIVCSVSSSSGGLVNKVSMFDKDMMFLVVFGLRGLKHEDEAQKALLCALTLKESLNDPNIISAARLMMVYPSKITCDKETFLRSKLDQEFFRLLEPKPLKGILKPGPVYEFNKLMWPQRSSCWRHPILGRNAEIRKYKMTLLNALKQQHQKFTRYRDHVYGVVFLGPDAVGKTRLVEECIAVTPKCIQVYRIRLTQAGKTLSSLSIVVIEEALFADDESWRLLLILMEGKSIFVVMTICDDSSLSETAYKCLSNNMLLKIRLGGIERWYHAALACQLLDVQAIPADLEKVIQSASDGMPGWIQNFVISLVQRGALSVVTVTQPEALQAGAVMPPPSLLNVDQPIEYDNLKDWMESCFKLQESNVSLGDPLHKIENRPPGPSTDNIQMAVLADSYNFEDMKVDMTMDAVAKLFLIRVLECEGGDFTRDGSMVLVHPAPAPVAIKPPYCACLGVRHLQIIRLRQSAAMYRKEKHVRSFSSLEMASCECLSILLSVYCQFIDHCRGAGEYEKLFEAYLEYAELCVMNNNIPQAIRLLFEVEAIARSEKYCTKLACKISWFKNYRLGRILSLRGACMLESGDMTEARKHLLHALELYSDPFPTTKFSMKLYNAQLSMRQVMLLYVAPQRYEATESGLAGLYYEEVAETLNRLYKMFCFSKCLRLEKRAMELCHRKRGQLDTTEVRSVCFLYTSLFLFYVEYGKKNESLEFGLSVMHMITNQTELNTRHLLILWMLKMLLTDLRIADMVVLMREFFYLTDHYDLSSMTWYHFYSMVILLDTGFCVESYQTCEKFYIKKGDAILRSKNPDSAWYFFVSMWLMTIRIGAWERTILWEDKIKQVTTMDFKEHEFNLLLLVRLVEGLLIMLVREHWKGILNPALVDYWVDHVEPENLLDYRDFNPAQGKQIVPYTLPLPRDFEK